MFLSNLRNPWWVPSCGNKYLTEKSQSGMLIFSNLSNLCPFITTTLPVEFSICSPEDRFWTLNINSVNSSITGLSGSYMGWIKILSFWLIHLWIASPEGGPQRSMSCHLNSYHLTKGLMRYLPPHHNTLRYLTAACNKIKLYYCS